MTASEVSKPDALPGDLDGKRVTIMGLGRFGGGVAAALHLAERGARLTITDLRTANDLEESIERIHSAGINVDWFLEGHPHEAFSGCEVLVVSPAVPPDNVIVQQCRSRSIQITSETELFVRNNPAYTIAVTGSNGKSTTTRLIGDLLTGHLPTERRVWVGGNIESSLLPEIARIDAHDVVVLELSSFQLHQLRGTGFRPDVAVVTSFTPNHLDWHKDLDHYTSSKHVITASQRPTDTMVLPTELDDWPGTGRCLRFGNSDSGEDGSYVEDGCVVVRFDDHEIAQRVSLSRALRGEHNLRNVAAAIGAASLVIGDDLDVGNTLQSFCGLPHRMQVVAKGRGRCFIDDSSSTTPESTIAALRTVNRPCVLIAGGADKGLDLRLVCEEIAQRTRAFVAIGATADAMSSAVRGAGVETESPVIQACTNFESAFAEAVALSEPGDIVLLSPGCSSYGWFADYRERGDAFAELAGKWCGLQEQIQ